MLGCALAVALAAGCGTSQGDGGGGTPTDAQVIDSGWVHVEIPEGWVAGEPLSEVWTETSQDAPGDAATQQVALSPENGHFTASMAVARAMAVLQVSGYQDFHRMDSLSSSDDDTRLRDNIAFTYVGDDDEEYEGVLWGAADEDRHAVLVQVTAKDLDDALVEQIDTSLQVQSDE